MGGGGSEPPAPPPPLDLSNGEGEEKSIEEANIQKTIATFERFKNVMNVLNKHNPFSIANVHH